MSMYDEEYPKSILEGNSLENEGSLILYKYIQDLMFRKKKKSADYAIRVNFPGEFFRSPQFFHLWPEPPVRFRVVKTMSNMSFMANTYKALTLSV